MLYRPTLVVESTILASRYALAKTLEFISFRSTLRETKPDYVNIEHRENEHSYRGSLLCLTPKFDITEYADQLERVGNYIYDKLIASGITKKGGSIQKTRTVEGSFYCIRSPLSDEHIAVYSLLAMAVFTYDDILDRRWKQFEDDPSPVKQLFRVFLEILNGECENIDSVPPSEFPMFKSLCEIFLEIRRGIENKSNTEEFLTEIKNYFDCYIRDFENRINGTILHSKQYLELSRVDGGMFLFLSLIHISEPTRPY